MRGVHEHTPLASPEMERRATDYDEASHPSDDSHSVRASPTKFGNRCLGTPQTDATATSWDAAVPRILKVVHEHEPLRSPEMERRVAGYDETFDSSDGGR